MVCMWLLPLYLIPARDLLAVCWSFKWMWTMPLSRSLGNLLRVYFDDVPALDAGQDLRRSYRMRNFHFVVTSFFSLSRLL
jgi:hypothetical protein